VSVGKAPGLQIELDGLAKAGAGALDIFPLRSDVQLRAARDIPSVSFGNQRGESVSHKPMLADVRGANKVCNEMLAYLAFVDLDVEVLRLPSSGSLRMTALGFRRQFQGLKFVR
jgi:hypothetical protein